MVCVALCNAAAAAGERTAKELIEQESLMTLETRRRVTTETTRKEWTEYEGICRLLLAFINYGRICTLHCRSSAIVIGLFRVVRWLSGRASDLRSSSRGFEARPRRCCATTLGKLFTPYCLCHQAV